MENIFLTQFVALSDWRSAGTLLALAALFALMKYLDSRRVDFSWRMLLGLAGGVGLGLSIQAMAGFPSQDAIQSTPWLKQTSLWYGLFANGFVGFIKMLIVPIILTSMIRVILRLDKGIDIRALVQRSLFWLLATTGIAALVGITLAASTGLGSTMSVQNINSGQIREVKNIVQVLLGIIPTNPVAAMAGDNVIAVVIFAAIVGSSARLMASKEKYAAVMKPFSDLTEACYRIVMSMAMTVIRFMPYAIIAMMARVIVSYGVSAIKEAGLFIVLIYAAALVMLVIYAILLMMHGLNPLPFFKKSFSTWVLAFSSRSSVGTLPITISTLENRLGVNSGTANFTASMGSTAGMNGCAGFFPAMAAVMVAQAVGVPLDAGFILLVVMVAILGSLGIAGIPGVATLAASIMLSGIGFSQYYGLLAIVLAIDPIIDMARTMINVAGAMTSAVLTDRWLGTLDAKAYADIHKLEDSKI